MTSTPRSVAERDALAIPELGMVDSVAAYYARKYPRLGLDRDDLAGWGRWALLLAAGRYDPAVGPFTPYARRYVEMTIRHEVVRAARRWGANSEWLASHGSEFEDLVATGDGPAAIEREDMVGWLLGHLSPREVEIIERRRGLNGRPSETLVRAAASMGMSDRHLLTLELAAMEKLRAAMAGVAPASPPITPKRRVARDTGLVTKVGARLAEGMGLNAIGREFGITLSSVQTIRDKLAGKPRRRCQKPEAPERRPDV